MNEPADRATPTPPWPIGPVAVFCLIGLVSNLLMLIGPIYMLQVYDRVLPSRSIPTLVALSLLVIGLYAFYALIELVRSRLAIRFGALIDEYLSRHVFRALVKSPRRAGGTDPVRDLDSIRQFLSGPGPVALFDLPWLPLYLGVIFLMHPLLGWVTACGAGAIAALLTINELFSHRLAQFVAVRSAGRQSQADDARGGAEAIVAMGMLPALTSRWTTAARELSDALVKSSDRTAFYASMTKASRFILQSMVLGTGAFLVISNESTAGLIIGASVISSRALAPVEQIVTQWRGFVAARHSASRLRVAMRASSESGPATLLPTPRATLTVECLATGPTLDRQPVVTEIDFSLRAGDGLGILGLSGSGKSSVARALVGVWPALTGAVRLDGSELSHFQSDLLGSNVGYLPQTVELFDGTVGENISRFVPDAAAETVLAAASAAGIHGFITGLPEGYDTRIGERGSILSAGQRQRVGLARALFGEPFLIVLDEPNSNLDTDGEAALTAALTSARARGAIVIVIAHRASAIAAVDKLLYLRRGRQVAFGSKEDVLRQITNAPQLVQPRRVAAASNG